MTLARVIVSATPSPETSATILSGMSVGSASIVHLARDVLEHAALLDAGRLLDALELERHRRLDLLVEPDLEQVEVDDVAADRIASAAP